MTAAVEIPHGRSRYRRLGCKCDICRGAVAAYATYRKRQIAYGRWERWTDAAPVREHVRTQMDAGLGWMRLARLAGISSSSVQRILYGNPAHGEPPTQKVRVETAHKILAVTAGVETFAPGAYIDATVTKRKIQALVAVGHTQIAIGREVGSGGTDITRILRSKYVTPAKAQDIDDVYRRWAFTPPTQTTPQQQVTARKMRTLAAKHGWVSALAWNDIEDPADRPVVDGPAWDGPDDAIVIALLAGRPTPSRLVDRKEAARRMILRGDPATLINDRLGTRWKMLQRIKAEIDTDKERADAAA